MTVEFINIYLQYNIFVRIEKDFNLFFFFRKAHCEIFQYYNEKNLKLSLVFMMFLFFGHYPAACFYKLYFYKEKIVYGKILSKKNIAVA